MSMYISTAPCCWGVDDPTNPHLPNWQTVLQEARLAGYQAIELGPYGYLPDEPALVEKVLAENQLGVVAGTIFDDLVSVSNQAKLIDQAHKICRLLSKLPKVEISSDKKYPPPYLVIIDWGNPKRDYAAGHSERAKRLSDQDWKNMMNHIINLAEIARQYGVRGVIHPHAGGHIEFSDEIAKLVEDVPYELAGLCLDTGHLYYAGMDPVETLKKYADRLDYVHFKDIHLAKFDDIMQKKIRFFEACAEGVMTRIGEGGLDYPQIKRTLEEIGYQGYITVEQERDPRNAVSSLEDVKISRNNLLKLGF